MLCSYSNPYSIEQNLVPREGNAAKEFKTRSKEGSKEGVDLVKGILEGRECFGVEKDWVRRVERR